MLYFFKKRPTQTPGVSNYSFEPNFTLPMQSPIGTGTAVRQLRAVFQAPQVFAPQLVLTSGLGGLQHGQMIFQPLIRQG